MNKFKRVLGVAALGAATPLLVQCEAAPAQNAEPAENTAATEDPFFPSLRGIGIAVADVDKSIAFYEALGMVPGRDRGQYKDMVWEADSKNSGVMLISVDDEAPDSFAPGGTYMMVMTDDTQAVANRLQEAGFDGFEPPRSVDGGADGTYSVMILDDPDGNFVELIGPAPAN